MDYVEEPVHAEPESYAIAADELVLVRNASARIAGAQAELGAEYDRHLAEVMRLRAQIEENRRAYIGLIDILAQKHVKGSGRHDFKPDIGAFVKARAYGT